MKSASNGGEQVLLFGTSGEASEGKNSQSVAG